MISCETFTLVRYNLFKYISFVKGVTIAIFFTESNEVYQIPTDFWVAQMIKSFSSEMWTRVELGNVWFDSEIVCK